MTTKRRRTLPPVSPKVSAELRPLVSAIAEIIETGEGVRGNPLDRKLTLRDLLDSGIGRLRNGFPPVKPWRFATRYRRTRSVHAPKTGGL